MLLRPLPYSPDSAQRFAPFSSLPGAVFLDSARPHSRAGRWDILSAEPHTTLTTRGNTTRIERRASACISEDDPFDLLRRELHQAMPAQSRPDGREWAELPFIGGAIGYFGYSLRLAGARCQKGFDQATALPDMVVGLYDWAILVDHQCQQAWLLAPNTARADEVEARLSDAAPDAWSPVSPQGFTGPLQTNLSPSDYAERFRRIQAYIRAGDCYQVNLALRFEAECTHAPWPLYQALRSANPAPFAAYMRTPDATLLSSSPERFLEARHGRVSTRPIKGTRPRASDPLLDQALATALASSLKDRAENLMIVDLLRNDLGQVCRPGTVKVPALFEVESFASVHHLVSTVTGELRPGQDAIALLRAALPGGSITGAPKRRAMEIIAELEPDPREVYCGALGYIGWDGVMDSNITIRTLVHRPGKVQFWAGSGIVADSDEAAEYQECLDKAAPLIRALAQSKI